MTTIDHAPAARERSAVRAVAMPAEHGGWGLTLEPVLLGLAVAASWGGAAIGLAAFGVFMVRTPLKLAWVDHRRGRSLARTVLARRIAAAELAVLAVLVVMAVALAGATWLVPAAIAAPLVGLAWWYDVRSRGRRLVPELAGAVGMSSVAAAIAVAGGADPELAVGLWILLAARSVGAIPFVRARIFQLHRGGAPTRPSDVAQAIAVLVAVAAVALDRALLVGAMAVSVVAVTHLIGVRRSPVPAKRVGFRQLGAGLAVVVATAIGVGFA